MSRVLVTGAAGFIGFHVSRRLMSDGHSVVGLDNLNAYYDVQLKLDRLAELKKSGLEFEFVKCDLADKAALSELFERSSFEYVVNLAAQAGVRYSLTNPEAYIASNLIGFANILELCRQNPVKHLVYASSSSVYGANTKLPFSVHDNVDHPVSLYAATKKANELMAHTYSHLFRIPTTGLRFFTVYGPWGRPDMAAFLFVKAMLEGKPIDVYNNGKMRRDFTYIDDIVEGIVRVLFSPAQPDASWSGDRPDPATSNAPFRIFNIGNHQPVELMEFIRILERLLGKKAIVNFREIQPGDVVATYADVDALTQAVGFAPSTPLEQGLARFTDWYQEYSRSRARISK